MIDNLTYAIIGNLNEAPNIVGIILDDAVAESKNIHPCPPRSASSLGNMRERRSVEVVTTTKQISLIDNCLSTLGMYDNTGLTVRG